MLLFSTQMSFNGNKQINSCSQFIHKNASAENIFDDVSADTQIRQEKKRKEKGCTCLIMLVLQQVLFSFFFHLKVGGGINERREKKLPLRFEPVIAGLRVQIVKPWSYLRKKGP